MPRTPRRVLAVAVLLGAAALATGQGTDLKAARIEAKPPSDPTGKLGLLREGKLKTLGPDAKANQELLRAVAKYHVYRATDDKYYVLPETGNLQPRDTQNTFDQVMIDLGRDLLTPGPETRYSAAQQEYIVEFGAALNEAVRDVLKRNPPPPIRVNCGRLLALAARSGAPALAPTIHELLTNKFPLEKGNPTKTPPELFLHTLTAAGNLFAAYHPQWQFDTEWRTQFRHSFDVKDQVLLAGDLLELLDKGPGVADLAAPTNPDRPVIRPVPLDGVAQPAPAAKLDATGPTPEQLHVTQYFRRHIAAAVCKIRPDLIVEAGSGKEPVRPGVAVARLAIGDAGLNPAVSTPEVAEAVLGLCYLAPTEQFNVPEALNALAVGGQTLVRHYQNRTTGDPELRRAAQLVPWRLYAERLNAALDHLTRQAGTNPRWQAHRATVAPLVQALRDDVVVPLRRAEATTPPSADRLTAIVANRQAAPPAERSLYKDDQRFKLTPRPAGP